MATPNYGYEKRQRELAKRKKKEEKLRNKSDRKHGDPEPGSDSEGQPDGTPAETNSSPTDTGGQPGQPAA